MRFLLIIFLPFFLLSCNGKSEETIPLTVTSALQGTGAGDSIIKDPNQELIDAAQSDHTLEFQGYEKKTLRVYHTSGRPTRVTFKNYDANSMEVTLDFLEEKKPNLRLSRITMPDGQLDGPFWDKIEYNLTQKGEYKLLFNENQKAEAPWSGIVDISIRLLPTEFPEAERVYP